MKEIYTDFKEGKLVSSVGLYDIIDELIKEIIA